MVASLWGSTLDTRSAAPRRSLLRSNRDIRSLFWSLGLFPIPLIVAYFSPWAALALLPCALYLGFCAGVLTHYHNHQGVFRSGTLNQLYSLWLSVFYGFPVFAWIPTHNQNHHRYTNGPLDATSTFRRGKEDSLYEALTYPTRSSAWQLPAVRAYLAQIRRTRPSEYRWCIAQIVTLIVAHVLLFAFFVHRHGAPLGALAYAASLGIPALFASWSMMFINYLQHVGCDPESPDHHSRNFVGRFENWLVFDAGLHTVHHEEPGLHWSRLRELHEARAASIHPILLQRNVFTFLWSRYFRGSSEHILVSRLAPSQSEEAA